MQQLRCSMCKATKSETDFNVCRARVTGRQNQCRTCQRATLRKSWHKNKHKYGAQGGR